MRRLAILFVATAALPAVGLLPADASAGCYRWGETGYHWYRFCFGPAFLYPHQRVCRRGYCWYGRARDARGGLITPAREEVGNGGRGLRRLRAGR
jgi:hypothetical protein